MYPPAIVSKIYTESKDGKFVEITCTMKVKNIPEALPIPVAEARFSVAVASNVANTSIAVESVSNRKVFFQTCVSPRILIYCDKNHIYIYIYVLHNFNFGQHWVRCNVSCLILLLKDIPDLDLMAYISKVLGKTSIRMNKLRHFSRT